MSLPIHSLMLANERDVVSARQRARSVAEALGFEHHDQIRIATAVSEIARNAFRYARGGTVTFHLNPDMGMFRISVTDQGGGIPHLDTVLGGSYRSNTGMGMGILGTKRLMDEFSIDSSTKGTVVQFGKLMPTHRRSIDSQELLRISTILSRQHPATPIDELQTQNRELMRTLDELRERKEELLRLNSELQDTNRGVVALYAELDERADYLRRASELKSSFLSNMSHEFRTPLNSMMALTRMLLDRMDGELTAEQEQQVRFIQRSAKELSEMVDDLLDLAKVEAGRLEVKPKKFKVDELFGALRGMLRPLLADSSLNLVFEDATDLPFLFTDEQKVSQVLRNFISNAIKFTPRGEVRISARAVGADVEFSVSDTGIGISRGDLDIIFEEFGQIENNMQKRVKGTGLGLPLARKLAGLLGGSVDVSSSIGEGSTFRLLVPSTYAGERPSTETPIPEVDPGRKLVLIVEDNSETAFVYERYLSNAGFQSHAVSSVQDARNVLLKVRPAAIIMDLMLRAETTWDFLRELKGATAPIPVLVMSVVDDERRIYGSGADAFLAKPFTPDQMIGHIVQLTSAADRLPILMIDDNEVSRYLLRGNIPDTVYEVYEARDGREGVAMALDVMPVLIFLDFYMPGLNGIEVLKDLRSRNDLKNIPVILHSTKLLEATEEVFFREQNVTVFPKQMLSRSDSSVRVRELIEAIIAHRAPAGKPDA
jgi:signal transduction histidine kinase/DNA-binding response OmpR family regulator